MFRKRIGLSQEELAAQLGVHKTNLSKIERGERGPPAKLLLALIPMCQGDICALRHIFGVQASEERGAPNSRFHDEPDKAGQASAALGAGAQSGGQFEEQTAPPIDPLDEPRLARIVAALSRSWRAGNAHHRGSLAARFEHAFPELAAAVLRQAAASAAGRAAATADSGAAKPSNDPPRPARQTRASKKPRPKIPKRVQKR